jgi:hypothetical protein
MSDTDFWVTVIYGLVIVPAFLFVTLYLPKWWRLKRRAESWHMLVFTADLGVIALDSLLRGYYELYGPAPWLFRITMLVAAVCLWHRVYLLFKYNYLDRREARKESNG